MSIMKNLFQSTSLHVSQLDKRLFLWISLFLFCVYNVTPVMVAIKCYSHEEWYGRTELNPLHQKTEL